MTTFQSVILGLLQGLTEFLPISSSGHLVILPWLLGWREHPLAFDIILHFATFCAIVLYFRREWFGILREGMRSITQRSFKGPVERNIFWCIVVASIPAIFVGGSVGTAMGRYLRNPFSVTLSLGIFGVILYLSELFGRRKKPLSALTLRMALCIGIAQVLALIPGVSRSGVTISAALFLGVDRESSVRFSFLLGAPLLLAAMVYEATGFGGFSNMLRWPTVLVGFTFSFISSLCAIHFLLSYVKRRSLTVFAVYRILVSSMIIIYFLNMN